VSTQVDQSPLDREALRARLVAPNGPYAALDVVDSTGSTNIDLRHAAVEGAPDRTVLIAERQTAGQGRRARRWVSPPGAGLYLSVLLRPAEVPVARLAGVTLLAGIALVRTARGTAGVDVALKWPNDLLAGEDRGKCAGVLAEVVDALREPVVVVGIGLNVGRLPPDIPAAGGGLSATSLSQAGAVTTDRTELAIALLTELASLDEQWRQAHGDLAASRLLDAYRDCCATLGQRVVVELPGRAKPAGPRDGVGDVVELRGIAVDVDREGQLMVRRDDGTVQAVSAGDVVHVHPQR
jgi:BirA family biotin operon repressor/biotin-[acetyl-CoA-carboxylase] ligase